MPPIKSPLLVIVPGACGIVAGFDKILPHLNGLQTESGAYPSYNPSFDPMNSTCLDDIGALNRTLVNLLDRGRDLVILAHSYGGVVAGGAAKGLDRTSRLAHGYTNAVIGLIYIAGNITLEGESLLDAIGGVYPPFIIPNKPSEGLVSVKPAMEILFNDCKADAELEKPVLPHALQAFETKASAPAWQDTGFDGRRAYIRTANDRCIPAPLQDAWIAKSRVEWDVVYFQSGHMPFISQPEALAAHIVKFVYRVMSH